MDTASTKEFSLRWNNFSNNLSSGFLSHLSENDLVDVTLAVEGQLLAAHKLVLSVCSPYFKNIFKEISCQQHPVIILKDVKHNEIAALLKFMYQGEVNMRHEDLPTFLKLAQMLQIKGLEGSEGQIMPLLNNYVNVSDPQYDFENVTTLSDAINKRENPSDESPHSHKIVKKSAKKRKKHVVEHDHNSIKESKNEPNIDNNDICLLIDDNEKNINDTESERVNIAGHVKHKTISNANNDNEEIVELPNESNSEENSTQLAVEPVIYRLSARGKPQLVHEGYVYNLTSRSKMYNNSHYRCAEQHRGCRGKCSVIAERFMPTGVHEHNHPPSYQSEYDYRKKKGLDTSNI